MTVQHPIPYETLAALVEQLPPEQQKALLARLQKVTVAHPLSPREKRALLRASILDVPVHEEPSIRR